MEREWPVVFPGEFHGQRSLASYSPWGRKEWPSKLLVLAVRPQHSQQSPEKLQASITSILQIRTLRLVEGNALAQDHKIRKSQSENMNLSHLIPVLFIQSLAHTLFFFNVFLFYH